MLKIDIITIFPGMFENITEFGIIKEAFKKNICRLNIYNLRDFTPYKQAKVDDRPYGGGPGMVLMPEPIDKAISFIKRRSQVKNKEKQKVVLLSPAGERLSQNKFKYMSGLENIIVICGRYEGVDERVIESMVDFEISIGDYVLSGGEIPAMVLIDGIIRLLPGVVGKAESLRSESFEKNLLDYPQYTRPPVFKRMAVPEILLSGNHKDIEKWRKEKSVEMTRKRRPDLFDKDS